MIEVDGPEEHMSMADENEVDEEPVRRDGSARGRGRRGHGRESSSGESRGEGRRERVRASRGRGHRFRGDIRLAVLALLGEQPMHGYQLMGEIEQRSSGAWRPSPGSIYPLLQQLTDEGLVQPTDDGGRKVFSLTAEGRALAEENADSRFWESRSAGRERVDLKAAVGALGHAAAQVARTGTPEQAKRAEEIIVEARKQLYRLLAED